MQAAGKIEKRLMFFIGIILLVSLYQFVGITHTNYMPFIAFCLVVSAFYFLKRFNMKVFINMVNAWNVVFYISASVILFVFELMMHEAEPKFNDLVRALTYLFYFSWMWFLYPEPKVMKKFMFRLCASCLAILIVEGLLEELFPVFMNLAYGRDPSRIGQITGSLVDRNSYSNALVIMLCICSMFWPETKTHIRVIVQVVCIVLCLHLVELSGSRTALVLLGVVVIFMFIRSLNQRTIAIAAVFSLVLVLALAIAWPFLKSYYQAHTESSVARLFFVENPKAKISNIERTNTIIAGINFVEDNYYVWGPGSIAFESRWGQVVSWERHVPHNVFLFMWCQFGILSLIPFYFIYVMGKRSVLGGSFLLYLLYFIDLLVSPNMYYYPYVFLITQIIDLNYFSKPEQAGPALNPVVD